MVQVIMPMTSSCWEDVIGVDCILPPKKVRGLKVRLAIITAGRICGHPVYLLGAII